jgi:large subunit ribosomal protein L5
MPVPYLKQLYREKVVPEITKLRGYTNPHQVPTLEKIVLNSRIKAESDKNFVQEVVKDITTISGQKPVITRARAAVANFKVRENMPVGVVVTLRGDNMWDFFLRLVAVTLPNIRDFRGVSRKFDGRGNYNLGIADHTIFPEIIMEPGRKTVGLDIVVVTTAKSDDEGRDLLRMLGVPFRSGPTAAQVAAREQHDKEHAAKMAAERAAALAAAAAAGPATPAPAAAAAPAKAAPAKAAPAKA